VQGLGALIILPRVFVLALMLGALFLVRYVVISPITAWRALRRARSP